MSENSQPIVNKPLVGLIGLTCLLSAGAGYIWWPGQTSLISACSRVGIVMAALYLALPKPGDNVRWERIAPIFVGTVVLIVLSRKMILVLLPLLLVAGVLMVLTRPRDRFRPPRPK